MSAILLRRTLSGLKADDDAASNALRKVPVGDVVKVELQQPRKHKNLARWWVLCDLIYESGAGEQFKSAEQVSDYLKIMAGHCTQIMSKSTGEIYLIPDSISFTRITESQFQAIWRRAVQAVAEHILPDISVADLENEILKLIGGAIGQIGTAEARPGT